MSRAFGLEMQPEPVTEFVRQKARQKQVLF